MDHLHKVSCFAAMLIGEIFISTSLPAAVVSTGDVQPELIIESINDYSRLGIGDFSDGGIQIDAGSVFRSNGYMLGGFYPDVTGSITVSGAGSQWINSGSLQYIGFSGRGIIAIENGGQYSETAFLGSNYLGYMPGSMGTVMVTDPGSRWTSKSTVYVGYEGSGTLTVADGGEIAVDQLYASLSNLFGNGTISVSRGGVLDTDLVFDASHGTKQTLSFGSGGSLNVNFSGGVLGVGYKEYGTLTVADGVQVTSRGGVLGEYSGSTGSATIIGAGSKWSNTGSLYVGKSGSGTLAVLDSGEVTTGSLYASVGSLSGNGTITATKGAVLDADLVFDATHGLQQSLTFGSGGSLNVNWSEGPIGVGYKQTGHLLVADGVNLTAGSCYLGYRPGSTGSATLRGNGTQLSDLDWIRVGYSGEGSLIIEEGGYVNSNSAELGYDVGSVGTATVSGADSRWVNDGSIYVGHRGSGSLTVADGGEVVTNTIWASLGDLHGNGTITTKGAILDADLHFDVTTGTQQTLSFGSGGSLIVNAAGGLLGAGYRQSGTLTVMDGVAVSSWSGYVGYDAGATGIATISGDGSKWSNNDQLYVGSSGRGTLVIEDGGQVTAWRTHLGGNGLGMARVTGTGSLLSNSDQLVVAGTLIVESGAEVTTDDGYLGSGAGVTGIATITGSGSKWNNSGTLDIGGHDNAVLMIEAGGQVTSATGYLGRPSSTTGVATVTGVGSNWTNTGALYVGEYGGGTLIVADGGEVITSVLFASPDDLEGNGTIHAAKGAVLDASLDFDSGHGTQQMLSFGSGGLLTITADGGDLGVGYHATGSLTVSDGVNLSSKNGYLGYGVDSVGTGLIIGSESKWNNVDALYVGRAGSGILALEAGGQVTSAQGYIGYGMVSGIVRVSGVGSAWTNTGSLTVGNSGSGSLAIEAGGYVSDTNGYLGSNPSSLGTASIRGANSHWFSSGSLYVGSSGSGSLIIESGGLVTNTDGYLGANASATGSALVTGAGSKWVNNGRLYIGEKGRGSLTVADGGEVVTQTLYASPDDLMGNGTISANKGVVFDANLIFDAAHGNQQALAFGSGGILKVTASGGDLGVGFRGHGSLTIVDGNSITSGYGQLGYKAGATGTAIVAGAGSYWRTGAINVGNSGNGVLSIEAGGQVRSDRAYVGTEPGSIGAVTVSGSKSVLTIWSYLCVGCSGAGSLTVEDGAEVLTYTNTMLGNANGSTGSAAVTGPGSRMTSWQFYVGQGGSGRLDITRGGFVRVLASLAVDYGRSGDSFINMSTGGMLALKGDADDSLSQFLNLVQGTDAIRYWNASLADWAPLTQATFGVDYTLQYLAAGEFAGYTLLTVGSIPEPASLLMAVCLCVPLLGRRGL